MTDLISRQDAIDAMKSISDSICEQQAIDALCELPSAQPEIIHCRNCKYYHDSEGCFFSTAETEENGFCYWAERRTDEQTD